jgi:hypothetical protein
MDDRSQRAIARLAEALLFLSTVRNQGDTTDVPIHIGPADAGHTVHVTARTAEALTGAIDSINAYMASETVEDDKIGNALRQVEAVIEIDEERMARSTARFTAWLEAQSGEAIGSGVWSAVAVAQNDPDTCAEVTDTFNEINLTKLHKEVHQDRQADRKSVDRALDDWFGDIVDPELVELYGDEDDA